MGIYYLPKQQYKCSKCGSLNFQEFVESLNYTYAGHNEGIRCLDCGHEIKWYKKSIMEEEMGSGFIYTNNPDVPKEF